ncbi:MAG: mechanosensitive ion channel family protein [Micavibrio sp.]
MNTIDIKFIEENLDIILAVGLDLILAMMILVAGWMIGNWVSKRIQTFKRLDETLADFLSGLSKYAIFTVSVVMMLSEFGVQTASLLAVLGAAGLAIGLALQGTLSNVAAGVMLLILRPFKIGDYITTGNDNIGGTVKSLGLFGTELAAPDNVYIFVPNSQIWTNDIWNYTRNPYRRQDINVGISYDDDINKAFSVINQTIAGDARIISDDEQMKPQVMANQMGDFSIDLIVRVWCKSPDYWNVRWDLTKAIKEALDAHGITIPFPTRKIEMVHVNQTDNQAAA